MSIYQSNWNPRGARKAWDKTSISNESATSALRDWIKGKVTDACAWFDEHDNLRILVADLDTGKRVTYRRNAREFTVQTEPRP